MTRMLNLRVVFVSLLVTAGTLVSGASVALAQETGGPSSPEALADHVTRSWREEATCLSQVPSLESQRVMEGEADRREQSTLAGATILYDAAERTLWALAEDPYAFVESADGHAARARQDVQAAYVALGGLEGLLGTQAADALLFAVLNEDDQRVHNWVTPGIVPGEGTPARMQCRSVRALQGVLSETDRRVREKGDEVRALLTEVKDLACREALGRVPSRPGTIPQFSGPLGCPEEAQPSERVLSSLVCPHDAHGQACEDAGHLDAALAVAWNAIHKTTPDPASVPPDAAGPSWAALPDSASSTRGDAA